MKKNKSIRSLDQVTVLTINYRTRDLVQRCVESLLAAYPKVRLLLIDNGSFDSSTEYIAQTANSHSQVRCILNQENLFHGPAMDQGLRHAHTPYVFTLDSDCEIIRGGFLEEMLALLQEPLIYAAGRLVTLDRFGFEQRNKAALPYIQPYAMLINRKTYFELPPFFHHGSPCLQNMRAATQAGYGLSAFPVETYIHHDWQGTCSRYGYGLGLRTSVQRLMSRLGILNF